MPLKVKVFGRAGSDYMKAIKKHLGNHKIAECRLAFNYGLQGKKLADFEAKYPQIQRLPIFNHKHAGNKYDHIMLAKEAGVPTPITARKPEEYPYAERPDGFRWIAKPYYSLGGRYIDYHDEGNALPKSHYVQGKIDNRRYELRCHAWAWVDPKEWIFQKRIHDKGEEVLCWNHHNGGKFVTVENPEEPLFQRCREEMKKLMKKFGYQFGAGDFIVQNPGKKGQPLKLYFIEWNLAPGWTLERTEKKYLEFFKRLELLKPEDVDLLTEGIFPWEEGYFEQPEDAPRGADHMPPEEPRVEVHRVEPDAQPVFRFGQGDMDAAVDAPEPANDAMNQWIQHEANELDRLMQDEFFMQSMKNLMITDEQLHIPGVLDIIKEHAHTLREADNNAQRIKERAEELRQRQAMEPREIAAVAMEAENDDARYAEAMGEAQAEMNFCPECGRPINVDIFGGLPKFCTSCGRKVRA